MVDQNAVTSYRTVWTLLSSVSHIGEVTGIDSPFHRVKVIQPDGSIEMVPTITGNSIRGILRRSGVLHLLNVIGENPMALDKFYLLFSGGALNKSDRKIDLNQARRVRALLPLIGLLGGAMGNYIMPGKLGVESLYPVAVETAHLLFGSEEGMNAAGYPSRSVYDYMQTESYTRFDDGKNPNHEGLIGEQVKSKDETAQQMRYNVETMSAGTDLIGGFTFNRASELEQGAFWAAFTYFARNPVIGGKSATGHGHVSVRFVTTDAEDKRVAYLINAPDEPNVLPSAKVYVEHLEENAPQIREFLYAAS